MKEYFKKHWNSIKADAVDKFPNESCGMIVDDKYVSCVNIAEDPAKHFKISDETYIYYSNTGKIDAIVHSHNDFIHLSLPDMEGQLKTSVPWGMVNVKNRNAQSIVFWGDQLEPQDLIGRPFCHGVYDCYSLMRDYFREKSIIIDVFPREWEWWNKGQNLYVEKLKDSAFADIDKKELQDGDIILFQMQSTVPNHCGVYIGDGLMMHHLPNRLSKREPANIWIKKYATHFLRYNG